jgi:oxygen-independent coproporphyrinogen-3 oxidase
VAEVADPARDAAAAPPLTGTLPPLQALDPAGSFAARHIGPRADETARMLTAIGRSSLEELVDAAVPEAVRDREPLRVPAAQGEATVLAALRERFAVAPDCEISLEANPGTVAESRLAALRELGVNRISFGVQTFDRDLLAELGRIHSAEQAVKARLAARTAGFDNVNLDFIYGLPRQTLAIWQQTLDRALELRPEHLSLYALTVEPGTLFFRRHERGDLPLPDEDLVADMYELASERLESAGYEQYEISNWALAPRFRCQHNLGYWRNREYLGVGPGAHSWFGGVRYVDLLSPVRWAKAIAAGGSPIASAERVPREVELGETLMLGLRLTEGVDFEEISRRFGINAPFRFAAVIRETQSLGLTEWHNGRLRLTRRARLLGNEVFGRFLEDAESEGMVAV